jgi:hypothetical protein
MINAPTAAYLAAYKENPPLPLSGRTFNSPRKIWNGIDVDYHLKDEWLEALNKLPVEIRSTEEGKGPLRPAHVAFRMLEGEDNLVPILKEILEDRGYNVYTDIGLMGRPRIVIAAELTPNDGKRWESWWNNLPIQIADAYSKAKVKSMRKR